MKIIDNININIIIFNRVACEWPLMGTCTLYWEGTCLNQVDQGSQRQENPPFVCPAMSMVRGQYWVRMCRGVSFASWQNLCYHSGLHVIIPTTVSH